MPESRLRNLAIEFAVKILNLVKDLKNQRETIFFPTRSAEREPVSVPTFMKPNMRMATGFHRQIANRIERSQ